MRLFVLILTFIGLLGCRMKDVGDWEQYSVRVGEQSLVFRIPPGQSQAGPAKPVPIDAASPVSSMAPNHFEEIFDGFWDYRSSKLRAVDGTLTLRIAVLGLQGPYDPNISDLSDLAEKIHEDSVARISTLNQKQEIRNRPLYPLPSKLPFKYVIHNGCAALIVANPSRLELFIPITNSVVVRARSTVGFYSGEQKLKGKAERISRKIIDSIMVASTGSDAGQNNCEFE